LQVPKSALPTHLILKTEDEFLDGSSKGIGFINRLTER